MDFSYYYTMKYNVYVDLLNLSIVAIMIPKGRTTIICLAQIGVSTNNLLFSFFIPPSLFKENLM